MHMFVPPPMLLLSAVPPLLRSYPGRAQLFVLFPDHGAYLRYFASVKAGVSSVAVSPQVEGKKTGDVFGSRVVP
jgi:hypothetical protein